MESPGYQLMTHLPTLKRCSDVKHKGKGDWHVLYLLADFSFEVVIILLCYGSPKVCMTGHKANETISSSTAPPAILRSVKIINWVSSSNASSVTRETSSDLEGMEEIWVVARTTIEHFIDHQESSGKVHFSFFIFPCLIKVCLLWWNRKKEIKLLFLFLLQSLSSVELTDPKKIHRKLIEGGRRELRICFFLFCPSWLPFLGLQNIIFEV